MPFYCSCPSPLGFGENPLAGAGLDPGPDPGEGELARETQTVVTVVLAMVLVERTDARPRPASPETSNPKNVMRLARIIHPVLRRRSSAAAGIFRPRVLLRRKPKESIMMPRFEAS
jgi:hypothetical protein